MIPLLILVLQLLAVPIISIVPVTYKVPVRQKQCLYDTLGINEYVTISAFISAGKVLKGNAYLQGPLAPSSVSSTQEIVASSVRFEKTPNRQDKKIINEKMEMNFEDVFDLDDDEYMDDDDFDDDDFMDDIMMEDYYYDYDDDDAFEFFEDDEMSPEEIEATRKRKDEWQGLSEDKKEEMRSKRKEAHKREMQVVIDKKKEAVAKRREQEKKDRKISSAEKEKRALQDGERFERTFQAKSDGWYQVCIEAAFGEISLELEMRKSSDVGNPNTKTGHLQSYERHEMKINERHMLSKMKNTKTEEGAEDIVKEGDLETSRDQLQQLNRLMNEIREKQMNERNRINAHSSVNEHSHSRMVLNSMFETVFYIVISGFQVYTIRKWFSGAPILGY